MKVIGLSLLLVLAIQNGMAQTPARTEPLYVIQPNDVLEIFVWKEPDLTRKVLVRPDGRVSFPLVQDLQALALAGGFQEFVRDQEMSIIRTSGTENSVFLSVAVLFVPFVAFLGYN